MDKKKDEPIKNPQSLADQFLCLYEAEISSFFEQHIREKWANNKTIMEEDLSEVLPENIKKETEFIRNIIESYEKWSQETDPVVLWDVDDTIGKYDHVRDNKWIFRPSIIPLMHFLQDKFPNVKNGILSNRSQMSDQLDQEPMIQTRFFFDKDHLYSSRNVEVSIDEHESIKAEVHAATNQYPNIDHEQKLVLVRDLQSKNLNVKIIDDNAVAKSLGDDGIHVWKYNLSF